MTNSSNLSAFQRLYGQAMVAPAGVRRSGPGTRSKNPEKYDRIKREREDRIKREREQANASAS